MKDKKRYDKSKEHIHLVDTRGNEYIAYRVKRRRKPYSPKKPRPVVPKRRTS